MSPAAELLADVRDWEVVAATLCVLSLAVDIEPCDREVAVVFVNACACERPTVLVLLVPALAPIVAVLELDGVL